MQVDTIVNKLSAYQTAIKWQNINGMINVVNMRNTFCFDLSLAFIKSVLNAPFFIFNFFFNIVTFYFIGKTSTFAALFAATPEAANWTWTCPQPNNYFNILFNH
jgi:hypothetical protein